tara:strand:- start:492 stop:731 length:240 start_codon:yes stop_codon:yes gene_type:complete
MKSLIAFFLIIFISSPVSIAYPTDQMDECILAAKSNPAVLQLPESAIEDFCDCALTLIIDEGNNDKESAKKCAKEKLNK